MRIKFLSSIPDNAIINSALASLLGITITIIISIMIARKWFRNMMVRIFHKTLNDDIWKDVLDLDNGSNLKVYLKDKDYYVIGHHKNHEEKGNDSWLALSAFGKYDKYTNKAYDKASIFHENSDYIITIRFSDIEHIEIF